MWHHPVTFHFVQLLSTSSNQESEMNHNEAVFGGGSVIRWLDQGKGRPMRAERESTVPLTGPKSRRKLGGRQ